jgi:hypothetical protein
MRCGEKLFIILFILLSDITKGEEILWKSKAILGRIGKVIIENEKLYLSDKSQAKILVFDLKGNLKEEIGRRGQGPGELDRIDDFDVWNNEIFIKESGSKIKHFDQKGREIESLNLFKYNIYFNKFFVLAKDRFLLIGVDLSKSHKEMEENKYNIFHIIDLESGEKESFGVPFKKMKGRKYPLHIVLWMEINFLKYNGDIYFYDVFEYNIFKVNLKKRFLEKLISEKVPYFVPLRGDLEIAYQNEHSAAVATDLVIPELHVFCEGKTIFVALKTEEKLWLRKYYSLNNKFYFQMEKELKDIENIFYHKDGIFYGVDKKNNLIAFIPSQ